MFCVVLTLWSALALVAHHHTNGIESAKCSICIAAHSVVPKPISKLSQVSFVVLAKVRTSSAAAKQRLVTFALTVRPPPEA
jgi:hypothetical protein